MQDCQIQGPLAKEQVLELIDNGTLKAEDEISAGNGYWFWVKEQELLEKYLHGTDVQPFNPVNSFEGQRGHYEEGTLPGIEDLEYPESGGWTTAADSFSRMAEQGEVSSSSSSEIVVNVNEDETSGEIHLGDEDLELEEGENDKENEEESTDVGILLENATMIQKADEEATQLPKEEDLDYPGEKPGEKPEEKATEEKPEEEKPKAKKKKSASPKPKAPKRQSGEKASFIKTFVATIAIVVIGVIICEKVFKYPILELILSIARAQEVTQANGTGASVLQDFSTESGWRGFVMSAKDSVVTEDCEQAKNYLVGVSMLLDKRDGQLERWKPFLQQCSSSIPKDIQTMLNMPNGVKLQQLRNHFKAWRLSSKQWEEISNIYRTVEKQRNGARMLGKILVLDGLKKKTSLLTGIS